MTERQIEVAARKLCEINGEDPEYSVPPEVPVDGIVFGARTPLWNFRKVQIVLHARALQAITFAKEGI